MNIDWFTFAAQIVNFLVLVALLRWLLYGPIVRAMRRREEKIASRLQEADQERAKAETRVGEYERKSQQLDEHREAMLMEARREAHEEHQRMLEEARAEVDRKREHWHETYRREREDIVSDVRRQAGQMAVEAARHALSQLADADLEKRMCDSFAARLRELGDEQREEIARYLGNGQANVSIRSTFDMPHQRRERLREMVRESFGHEGEISFEQSRDLICGLELDIGGYSFGWNVKEFLHDLELEFDERLKSSE